MKQFDNETLVAEYEKCKRCRIVAEKYGCSDETVRRALIKAGIPRKGNKGREKPQKRLARQTGATPEELRQIVEEYYSTSETINDLAAKYRRSQTTISNAIKTYGHGIKYNPINGKKITDDQLREASKTMTCGEIAKKYGMSEERVFRRAQKLGIKVLIRWAGGHWQRRAERYGCNEFDKTISLRLLICRDNGICQICGKPVDMADIKNGHIGRHYPTLDHIIPLSKGGSHTWDNVQLAHMGCNAGKCDKEEYNVKAG